MNTKTLHQQKQYLEIQKVAHEHSHKLMIEFISRIQVHLEIIKNGLKQKAEEQRNDFNSSIGGLEERIWDIADRIQNEGNHDG